MKVLVGAVALLVSLVTTHAQAAASFNVNVSQDGKRVNIAFSTKETHTAMCHLTTTRIEVDKKMGGFGGDRREIGSIEIEAAQDPRQFCLMAFGPHRGSVSFEKGSALPALSNGKYGLRINGEKYGALVVKENEVSLED